MYFRAFLVTQKMHAVFEEHKRVLRSCFEQLPYDNARAPRNVETLNTSLVGHAILWVSTGIALEIVDSFRSILFFGSLPVWARTG